MEDKMELDLSLDDIIKMNKKNQHKTNRNSNTRSNNNNNNNNQRPKLQRLRNLGIRSGITRRSDSSQVKISPRKEPTMLHVSNLHYNVSNADVKTLFSDIGPVKKAVVHYDKSGRSLGTAEVTFTTREAAIRAINKYNNLPLDGRPMNITLVPSSNSTLRSPIKGKIGIKSSSGIHKRQSSKTSNNNTRSGPNTKGGRPTSVRGKKPGFTRKPRPQVTAEELDADLEAYRSGAGQ